MTRALRAWIGLAVLALALRAGWGLRGPVVIEDEGTYYARVGENLAAHRGYAGLDELGAQLIYPPLYPGLIAAGVKLGLTSESAGRAVSLFFGTLTPIVFALITAWLYGAMAGWCAGLLAALHPLLIAASLAVLSESTYLCLVLLGIYLALRLVRAPRPRLAAGAGACLGLAYLCRPEALFLTVVLAAILVGANGANRRAVMAAITMVSVFAVLAVPYVAFLRRETGQWRFEAKTPQGIIWQLGAAAGQGAGQLYWGIDADLAGHGLSNTSDSAQAQVAKPPLSTRVRTAARQVRHNAPNLLRGLAHLQFGMPMFALLAGLGLFAGSWTTVRARDELPLLGLGALVVGPFLLWPFVLDRSLFMLLGPGIVWAGNGLARLGAWARDSGRELGAGSGGQRLAATAVVVTATLPMIGASIIGVWGTDEMSQGWSRSRAEYKTVGRWVAAQAPHARIVDIGPAVAYYAGGVLINFPWSDGATALRYIAFRDAAFVVLREQGLGARPYLRGWFAEVPDARLQLVETFRGAAGMIRVYRWTDSSSTTGTGRPGGPPGSAKAGPVPAAISATPPAFPLRVRPGARYLTDARSRPFLVQGDAPWELISQLTREQVDRYLAERQAQGFNTILVQLIDSHFATNAPRNAYGDAPFLTPGDFSTPNETYFAHADFALRRAEEMGFLVLLAPAYMGYEGGDEGWYRSMVANGPEKLRAFGQYLARRFRGRDNLIWVQGGDFDPPDRLLLRALANGIREGEPKWLQTFHGARGTSALGFLGAEPWVGVNTIYTDSNVVASARTERARSTIPFFLIEAMYEDDASESLVRRQAYQAVLAGSTGQVMGLNPVWSFGPGWEAALQSPGARTLVHLKRLMDARPWWTLEPDTGVFLTSGFGRAPDQTTAAVAGDRSFAIVYLPSVRAIGVDLRRLRGPRVATQWYDPTSGVYTAAIGLPSSSPGRAVFRPSGGNGRHGGDWVLVIESAK